MNMDNTLRATIELAPCPFCGETPDINNADTFQCDQGDKWGYVVCCCRGPEVRTSYMPVPHWRDDAIREWNRRAIREELSREGWKLVPTKPTEEMLRAGWNAHLDNKKGGFVRFSLTYKAMLQAAPKP